MGTIDITREAFNARQACALTETTTKQLVYWDNEGLVKPSVSPAAGRGSRRVYSYRDLLALKTVSKLREQGVSLQRIRKCVLYLRKHLTDVSEPLVFCSLITDGQTVFLVEDEQTLVDTVRAQGQRVFLQLSIAAIDRELRQKVIPLSGKRVHTVAVGDYAYQVEVEADTECGGFVAEVAGLPGCITEGDTLDETLENAQDAIETYLEAVSDLAKQGVKLPVRRGRPRRATGS
ncbi:MAG TPA: MerR family transcriptional regulator [Phycisphaerae bacterium]|nr:MerR family transcriptional regulator [Phycisphaerae bacterium]